MNKKQYLNAFKNLLTVLPTSEKLYSLANKAMQAGEGEKSKNIWNERLGKNLPAVLAVASINFLKEKLEQVISEDPDGFMEALGKAYSTYVDVRKLRYSEERNFKLLRVFGITTYKCYYPNCQEDHILYYYRNTPKTEEELEKQAEEILNDYHDTLRVIYLVPETMLKELTLNISVVGIETE